MEYNILLETDFFNLLNAGHKNKGGNALENSYREFIKVVVDLCSTNVKQAVFALSYAETELDFHLSMPHIKDCLEIVGIVCNAKLLHLSAECKSMWQQHIIFM